MSNILVQGQTENPLAPQWGTITLTAGLNSQTVTLTTDLGWAAFADANWAGVLNSRTSGTSQFIASYGATTCLLYFSTNNTAVVDIIGIGRKA